MNITQIFFRSWLLRLNFRYLTSLHPAGSPKSYMVIPAKAGQRLVEYPIILRRNRSNYWIQLLLVACLFTLPYMTFAQSSDNLIYLHHADSLVGLDINGERARQLIGNVKFTHGKTTVTCRKAVQYLQSNKATLEGEVVVTEDSLTMTALHGTYYGSTKIAEASGRVRLDDHKVVLYADFGTYYSNERMAHFRQNVRLYDSSTVLTSDELQYYRDEQKTIAESNVVIVNSENNMTLRGEHFENYRKINYSKMTEHPRATHKDTSGSKTDSLVIISDTMETYQQAPERLVATGNVFMYRSDIASEAGYGVFFTKLDSIELHGSPFVWHTQENGTVTQASGDSMYVKIKKKRLDMLYIFGHAFSLSEADSSLPKRLHQISGQDMTMYFKENKINTIQVDKTATILYYLFDGKTPNGLNNTTGDHITISFLDGKIERLKVVGGVEGKYVPEKLVYGREEEYNLTGYNWKEKPVLR
ncbi:MAG: hypothetical protein EPO24_00610 [Bacteroidetes bacterium]|nr:MAG: hypothetical protein EPO24_00610 [Bacteroidota bacterium]